MDKPSALVERNGSELSQLLPSSDAGAAARGSSGVIPDRTV
eukprot:SAG25_NODE_414_length_8276_cov_29.934939_5_plen_41_part_00